MGLMDGSCSLLLIMRVAGDIVTSIHENAEKRGNTKLFHLIYQHNYFANDREWLLQCKSRCGMEGNIVSISWSSALAWNRRRSLSEWTSQTGTWSLGLSRSIGS
jgi:hypothetical protein